MDDSIAHPGARTGLLDLPAWKSVLSVSSAVLLGLLFIVAGVWKITDPLDASARLAQAKVPGALSLPLALILGTVETFAGALLLVPRFRRWGAWLTGFMLAAFMVYIGIHYEALRGEECSCFPWIKRAVGPGFFIGDAIMLALAAAAGWWARPSESRRSAVLILAAVAVFTGVSYGVTITQQSGLQAPDTIIVEGKPVAVHQGRVLLYFFDPECSVCYKAAQLLGTYNWKDTRVIGLAVERPQFATQFLNDTGLRASLSPDAAMLRQTFAFEYAPYAVALQHGRQKAAFSHFEDAQLQAKLRELGFIE